MEFHTRLRFLRKKFNLTQEELATILGLKPTAISNYESKRNEPSFEKLIALSKYFGVSCDYLLCVTDTDTPNSEIILNKGIETLLQLCKHINEENTLELKNYAKYLLYKQDGLLLK